MKEDVKQLWVASLKSGEFIQGQQSLRSDDDKFCCLGTLCELFLRHNPDTKLDWKKNEYGHYHFDGCNSVLPKSVREWAGLDECNPRVNDYAWSQKTLAAMNDAGCDFIGIAEIIEKNL